MRLVLIGLVAGFFSALFGVGGGIVIAVHGDVDVAYAALVGVPAAASVGFATALQQRLRTRTIELLFAAFLIGVAVWLFLK